MKKYLLKNIKSVLVLVLSLFFLTSCFESDEDFGSDANKVVAKVFDFAGTDIANVGDVVEFSVTPRAGSTFLWSATGAEVQPVAGATEKVNINFNQIGAATVTVQEQLANGKTSDPVTMNVNVLQLCNWTIEMNDSYGDGWNGASVDITFTGAATIAPVNATIDAGSSGTLTFAAPSGYTMDVKFNSGAWDGEITYSIKDASGTVVFSDGPTPTVGVAYSTTVSCP